MAKSKRGRTLWKLPSRGRGTCPTCSRTRIKLLYPRATKSGSSITVCKRCLNAEQSRVDAVIG
ncbi:hypothetical protein [Bacillus sp. FJAT-28004]|uniref:hypothetical protein n=1 Tax=Bacillus sp. FJAT-28004 TaxID=1679165 RepID=UPI0009E92CE4|nr:hypothetical protein [Bacillus sp. FJAT-28004]